MAALEYVGRYPDSDSVLVPKKYADADNAATAVTNAFIDQQCAVQGANLVTPAWVTQQAANYATQSAVNAANAAYLPLSSLAVANGAAKLNGSGVIPAGQLPALVTNRQALSYNIATTGTNFLGSSSFTTTTTNLNEYIIASIPIPDPGFPWIPWPFVYISAQAAGTPSGSRFVGNGNFGFLTVMPPSGVSNTIYGGGVCTDDTVTSWYQLIPGANATNPQNPITPLSNPPILGPLTLNLGACCWAGAGYTWNGPGLVFHITVLPALGTGAIPSLN